MTIKILLIVISLLLGGNSSEEIGREDSTGMVQEDYLVGKFQRKDLEQKPHSFWFNSGYKSYKPGKEQMKRIKENISEYEIYLFMGTWCADSQLEVPKLFKILDQAGFDNSKLTNIAVDLYKETPDHLEKDFDVMLVPTIIFYKDGKEVNRFVEFPMESLEEDIADIVSEETYKNPYADF